MNKQMIFFAIITLINVMLSTTKSVLTVRADKGVATIINAISYGFYAMVVKQMAEIELVAVVIITVLANIVGVYFSLWILEKTKKVKTWKISLVLKDIEVENITKELAKEKIGYNIIKAETKYSDEILEIFTKSKEESKIVKEMLNGGYKYNIIELGHRL